MDKPHKYSEDIVSHIGFTENTGTCEVCGKRAAHPIHRKKFRNKPVSYQLFMEQRKKNR